MKKSITAIAFALGLGTIQQSEAAITYAFSVSGNDVILDISGSLDLTGLTETVLAPTLGADLFIASGATEFGAGADVAANAWNLALQNDVFTTTTTQIFAAVDSWNSNASVIRIEEANNRMFLDDSFQTGDTVTVTGAQFTFSNVDLSDFNLTAGQNTLWFQNSNATGTDGDVYVTAIPEPSTLALIGLGGLLCLRRRRS